jgi:ubiquinone/menaquinone biosynthesis C-methylase UbiE
MPDAAPRLKGDRPPRPNTSRNTHAVVLDLLRAHGPQTVLDAPCGEGALAWELAQGGIHPVCLDCAPDVLLIQGVEFHHGDLAATLPFPDASFDAAACVDGLEHLENPTHALRQFHRVLRPGGLLVVSTPNINAMRSRARFLLTACHHKFKRPLDETAPHPRHHITPITYPQLRYMLHTTGFRLTAVRANRAKAVSYAYAPLWPLAALATWLSFRREKDPAQRDRNRAIRRTLLSPALFFGETLIAAAEKTETP